MFFSSRLRTSFFQNQLITLTFCTLFSGVAYTSEFKHITEIPSVNDISEPNFVIPNEYSVDKLNKLLAALPSDGHLGHAGVGTERVTMTFHRSKVNALYLVDIDPAVHWFNFVNKKLIKVSSNAADYRLRRFKITEDLPLSWSGTGLEKGDYVKWKEFHKPGGVLAAIQAGMFGQDTYAWDDDTFQALKKIVEDDRFYILNADLTNSEHISSLKDFVLEKNPNGLFTFDVSNVPTLPTVDLEAALTNWKEKIPLDSGYYIETYLNESTFQYLISFNIKRVTTSRLEELRERGRNTEEAVQVINCN